MPEPGSDEPGARQSAGAPLAARRARCRGAVVAAAPHETGLALQPRQRRFDRRVTGLDDLPGHQRVGQRVERGDGLGCGEGEVEAGDTVAPGAELVAVRGEPSARAETGESGLQPVDGDLVAALETKP
jgi:hypothetical protein